MEGSGEKTEKSTEDLEEKKEQKKEQKKVELTLEELANWDRKSKRAAAQIKQLSEENNNLKAELAAFTKKSEERRIQDR